MMDTMMDAAGSRPSRRQVLTGGAAVLAGTTGLVGRTGPAYAAQRVRPPKTIELETVVVRTGDYKYLPFRVPHGRSAGRLRRRGGSGVDRVGPATHQPELKALRLRFLSLGSALEPTPYRFVRLREGRLGVLRPDEPNSYRFVRLRAGRLGVLRPDEPAAAGHREEPCHPLACLFIAGTPRDWDCSPTTTSLSPCRRHRAAWPLARSRRSVLPCPRPRHPWSPGYHHRVPTSEERGLSLSVLGTYRRPDEISVAARRQRGERYDDDLVHRPLTSRIRRAPLRAKRGRGPELAWTLLAP